MKIFGREIFPSAEEKAKEAAGEVKVDMTEATPGEVDQDSTSQENAGDSNPAQ